MTKAMDSTAEEGTQEQASSKGSENQQGQQSSSAEYVTVDQFNQLAETLRRTLQGEKDRGVKRTNERLDRIEGDVRTVLQNAQREGKSITDVLEAMDEAEEREFRQSMREMVSAFQSGRFPQPSDRQSDKSAGVDISEVLGDLELDTEDVRVKAFQAKQFSSVDEAYREGAKLRKSIKTNQPSGADKAGEVSRESKPMPKQDELMREYQEGSKTLYGRDLLNFKQQMRQKGLRIS